MPPDLTRQMIAAVLRHGSRDAPTDRELLARFVTDRSEDSFAELVRRHGSVVLAVCRRVTGHLQDAEDAFQAAFMVLARRAAHIGKPELLGNWMYGVAYRTALEARNARRRVKEQHPVSAIPEPSAPLPPDDSADLRAAIDEELARLPERYRAAVVLCDLEGLCRKDAAGRLRIPEGTLSSRLAHARKVLAGKLSRRGITASAAAVSTTLGRDAAAVSLPHQLVLITARAAARSLSGAGLTPDLISNRVTTLTEGVMKAMIATRLRTLTGAGMVALTLLGLGSAAVIGQNTPAAQTAKTRTIVLEVEDPVITPAPKAAKAKPKPPVEKKFAAKGIEDDDVPYAGVPGQAVVRYENDKLIVRQRIRIVAGTHTEVNGTLMTSYEVRSTVSGKTSDPADVSVFDMKGNRIADKVWKEKLKADQHVLLVNEGKLPHPRELTLFKDDTLLIVLPVHTGEYGVSTTNADVHLLRRGTGGNGTLFEGIPAAVWNMAAPASLPPTPVVPPPPVPPRPNFLKPVLK